MSCKCAKIEGEADLDIPLREIVPVNQNFADLVFGIGIFTFGVVVLDQELAVAVLDDGFRVVLNLIYNTEDFGDLHIERRFGAVENVAIWVGSFVSVIRSSTSLA